MHIKTISVISRRTRAAGYGLVLLLTTVAHAQAMDAEAPSATQVTAPTPSLPTRGMPMEQVEHVLGVPKERLAPVGKPPITRWIYDAYTVYFEKRRVIHTVVSHK